jgi:hypothetical protein
LLVSTFLVVGVKSYHIIAAALLTLLKFEQKIISSAASQVELSRFRATGTSSSSSSSSGGGGGKSGQHQQQQQQQQQQKLIADANVQGRSLLLKFVTTVAIVFLTVLVRSTFHILYAIAQGGQDYGNSCAPSQCSKCKNVG